ncbi:MAG TPA: hypothetical protein VGM57_14645 [Pseudolabrys sp.]|jgi:hypothetical protein
MYRPMLAALVSAFAVTLPLMSVAQTPPPATTAPAAPRADAPKADAPKADAAPAHKAYVPGLEQFMNVILMEHNKLWFAAKARNWPLAEYELGEIKEVMGDVQDIVPVFKNLPLADMLDAVITKEIVDLEKAIAAKDYKTFVASYDKLNAACNACHAGTENGFVVIKRPTSPVFTNQDYAPQKK